MDMINLETNLLGTDETNKTLFTMKKEMEIYFHLDLMGIWQHSGSLDSIFALQQGGPDWSPACSSWNPKTFSSGELESPTDVNVSVNGCQIVCVSSYKQPVHVATCPRCTLPLTHYQCARTGTLPDVAPHGIHNSMTNNISHLGPTSDNLPSPNLEPKHKTSMYACN